MNLDDTIVAVSSPPGSGARGIVRLSGPEACRISDRFVRAIADASHESLAGASHLTGRIDVAGTLLPSTVYIFKSPRSYTRQDLVEIHLLGSPSVLGILVEQCLAFGARRAEPGEFTARAFLAGALDLSQVHGIAGMIAARSDLQLQAASRLLHGELARSAQIAREELSDLLSLVEGAMDFADEPIEFIAPMELRRRLASVHHALQSTAAAGLRAERWGELCRVLLAGPPNVGKSSLLNCLSGLDRAICASMAGTTRDVLTAPLALDGLDCLLMDVAGLDDPTTNLDATAQSAAQTAIQNADLVLHVLDASSLSNQHLGLVSAAREVEAPVEPQYPHVAAPVVIVLNKCDLLNDSETDAIRRSFAGQSARPILLVSAATGQGCDALKQAIAGVLSDRPVDINDAAIALVAEHRQALDDALRCLSSAIDLAERAGETLTDADLVAAELHAAADALGTLIGLDDTEDLLGRIFSRFCVGK